MPSIPRYKDGRPWIVPPGGDKPVRYTRTSKFANTMDDGYGLDLHHQHMVAIGLEKNGWVFKKVREAYTQEEERGYDWNKMNAACAKAMDLAGANVKSEWGTYMHSLTERADSGEVVREVGDHRALADLMAYEYTTERLKHSDIERFCVDDEFGVAGTPDRRSWIENAVLPTGEILSDWVIADLKTGRLDGSDVKFAVQLARYSRSKWYRCTHNVEGDPSKGQCAENLEAHEREPIEVNQDWGLIIDLPRHEGRCELRWIDLQKGHRLSELCRTVREERRTKTFGELFFLD